MACGRGGRNVSARVRPGAAAFLLFGRKFAVVVNVGRGHRGVAHRDDDLVEASRNTACRVEAGHGGELVLVDEQRAFLVALGPQRRRQTRPARICYNQPLPCEIHEQRPVQTRSGQAGR